MLASIDKAGHNAWDGGIVPVALWQRVPDRRDGSHQDRRTWDTGQDVLDQVGQALWGSGGVLLHVVGPSQDENDIGLEAKGGVCEAADLVDRGAGVALVVIFRHVSRGLGAHDLDVIAVTAQEHVLAVAVPIRTLVTPGDGIYTHTRSVKEMIRP